MTETAPPALREQRIVRALDQKIREMPEKMVKELKARALDLPAMLRRHGLLQVLLFLHSKKDHCLATCLHQGMAALGAPAVEPDVNKFRASLPDMPLALYLLHWEAAVEVATWLKRLVEERTWVSEAPSSDPASPAS